MKAKEQIKPWSITLAMSITDRIRLEGTFVLTERQAWRVAERFKMLFEKKTGHTVIAMIIDTNGVKKNGKH